MAINLTDVGFKCNIIEQTLNMNPILYGTIILYFVILMSLIYFFDIKLKDKWRKNEVSKVSDVPNGHGK